MQISTPILMVKQVLHFSIKIILSRTANWRNFATSKVSCTRPFHPQVFLKDERFAKILVV